jgi:hypothetical protein
MVVYFLTSVVGLQRWVDYIPVKLTQGGTENSYNNNGYINVAVLPSLSSQTQAWKEYIPVYQDDVATDAWQVNSIGYIPYNYALFGDASLMLDFTNGGSIDPRVTFTRTSNATVTDSTGTLVYAPHNLFTFSESFDNGAWGRNACTILANSAVAPDDTNTADKIEETAGTNFFAINRNPSGEFSTLYTHSIYAKAAERTNIQVSFTVSSATVIFNLQNGTVRSTSGANLVSASLEAVGDGWYRCVTVIRSAASGSNILYHIVGPADGSATTYTGIAGNGVYIWGAQLNVGSLQPYYPTTVKNLLGFTQEFDNAAWTKSNATVTANAAIDPQGFMTADKLVESGSGSLAHYIGQGVITTIVGTEYTLSYYAKADERNWIQLSGASAQFGSSQWANFDLVNGVVGNKGTTQTNETITAVGNGWYRCSITITATVASSTTTGYLLVLSANAASRFPGYEAEAGKGVFIWGAQLSDSASLDSYVYNPGAAPASTAYYGPRFDYDPVTLAPKGLLIEEQRTNLLLQSEDFSTTWTNANSVEQTNVAVSPEGTQDADLLLADSATTTAARDLRQNVNGTVTAVHTFSVYAKARNGNFLAVTFRNQAAAANFCTAEFNLSTGNISIAGENGGNATGATARIVDAGNGWYRCSVSGVADTSGTQFTALLVGRTTSGTNNVSANTELCYLWGAQLEAGAFATSYIPTTTAAATRAADVAVMTGANFSNWYNQSEGTFFGAFSTIWTGSSTLASTNPGLLAVNNAETVSLNGYASRLPTATTSSLRWGSRNGATTSEITTAFNGFLQAGEQYAVAGAYASNLVAQSVNGGSAVTTTDANYGLMTINRLEIGFQRVGGSTTQLNGHIRRIAYYPRRLSNAELQGITS